MKVWVIWRHGETIRDRNHNMAVFASQDVALEFVHKTYPDWKRAKDFEVYEYNVIGEV